MSLFTENLFFNLALPWDNGRKPLITFRKFSELPTSPIQNESNLVCLENYLHLSRTVLSSISTLNSLSAFWSQTVEIMFDASNVSIALHIFFATSLEFLSISLGFKWPDDLVSSYFRGDFSKSFKNRRFKHDLYSWRKCNMPSWLHFCIYTMRLLEHIQYLFLWQFLNCRCFSDLRT